MIDNKVGKGGEKMYEWLEVNDIERFCEKFFRINEYKDEFF